MASGESESERGGREVRDALKELHAVGKCVDSVHKDRVFEKGSLGPVVVRHLVAHDLRRQGKGRAGE